MRPRSREGRRKAFLEAAERLFEEMEEWYDAHPEASFGEIEAKLRQERRRLMGETAEILVNGRQSGQQAEAYGYKLITRGTVEEKILALQERKRNLVDQLISTETALFKQLTPDDIQLLFSQ